MSRSFILSFMINTACEENVVSKQDASESVNSFFTTRSISSVGSLAATADIFKVFLFVLDGSFVCFVHCPIKVDVVEIEDDGLLWKIPFLCFAAAQSCILLDLVSYS